MSRRKTVLVVEDKVDLIDELYKRALRTIDADVEYATDKLEALERVRCRRFDIAFIDIMLKEDMTDRGGLDVIRYLDKVDEGTAMVVVSATDDIRVAIAGYKAGIVEFIQKPFSKADISQITEKVLSCQDMPNFFGRYSTICAYLARPQLVPSWEGMMMSSLQVGYEILNNGLLEAVERMLPIMREKRLPGSFRFSGNGRSVFGNFWSKGLGKPLWIAMAGEGGILAPPPEHLQVEHVYERTKGALSISMWTMSGPRRDDFYESVWEECE